MVLKGAEWTIRTVDGLIDPRCMGMLMYVDCNEQTLEFLEALD